MPARGAAPRTASADTRGGGARLEHVGHLAALAVDNPDVAEVGPQIGEVRRAKCQGVDVVAAGDLEVARDAPLRRVGDGAARGQEGHRGERGEPWIARLGAEPGRRIALDQREPRAQQLEIVDRSARRGVAVVEREPTRDERDQGASLHAGQRDPRAGQRRAVAVVDFHDQRGGDGAHQIHVEALGVEIGVVEPEPIDRVAAGHRFLGSARAGGEDADVAPERDVVGGDGDPLDRRPGPGIDAIAGGPARRRLEPHQRRLPCPAAAAEVRAQHGGDAAQRHRSGADVVDRHPDVARRQRRRLLDDGVVDPATAPRPIEDPRVRGDPRPLRAVERRLDVEALAEVGAVDVELEPIERRDVFEVDDPRRHPATHVLRFDEAPAVPPLGGPRHVHVEHVRHLAPVRGDESEVGEVGLAVLGHVGRDGDGRETPIRGHAGRHGHGTPVLPRRPRLVRRRRLSGRRLSGQDDARDGDDDAGESGRERTRPAAERGTRRHGCFLPTKRW